MRGSFTRVALAATLGVLGLAGCAGADEAPTEVLAAPELRTDIEPLAGRLPTLGSDFTAQWFSNTTFDQRAPGPASYWIDALITPAAGVEGLIDDHTLTPGTPDVGEQLTALVPACEWERADSIDRAWGPLDWETHVWFCLERDQLVISMLGGN